MPDWTYQTVFRPVLMAMGPESGRRTAFGFMGLLARMPWGRHVIRLMGHMQPDERLRSEHAGLSFLSPVGLGCALDPHSLATPAFAEFGFGFLEVGPVRLKPGAKTGPIAVDPANESIPCQSPQAALTPIALAERLQQDGPFSLPILARIEPASPEACQQMKLLLDELVAGYTVPFDSLDFLFPPGSLGKETNFRKPILVVLDPKNWRDSEIQSRVSKLIQTGTLAGAIVVPTGEDGVQTFGKPEFPAAVQTVKGIREKLGVGPLLIGSVGVHSPADALDYLEAGANLVQVDSGLVFAGPGLPKRINEAVLYRRLAAESPPSKESKRPGGQSWFWALLMGFSMLFGGLLAMLIASTRVVMPYDEAMAGLSREELTAINDRLLAFMSHDRVTLAGTMLAVGVLYIAYAWWGIRRGVHWAYVSVVASAFAGFLSFFSFLGFGYFDPFHAFVTAVMFQFLLFTIHAELPERGKMEPPDLWNDGRFKANQWGQLLFVVHGAVLIAAGLVISSVGMTSVFVPEDLHFMDTTAEELFGAHPSLVPLVAHDRATFGGMLIACGVATFLPALWGFRRGQFWLWYALMAAGSIAYISTILVHWIVGYHSLKHLLPAYFGLLGLWIGGFLSYRYLVAKDEKLEAEWNRRLVHSPSSNP